MSSVHPFVASPGKGCSSCGKLRSDPIHNYQEHRALEAHKVTGHSYTEHRTYTGSGCAVCGKPKAGHA